MRKFRIILEVEDAEVNDEYPADKVWEDYKELIRDNWAVSVLSGSSEEIQPT
jgi:uncharacterized protein YifE (UPF0438 family)